MASPNDEVDPRSHKAQLLLSAPQGVVRPKLKEPRICMFCDSSSGRFMLRLLIQRLLKAIREALRPGSNDYIAIVADILRQHVEGTQILSPKRAARLISDFIHECDELQYFLEEISRRGNASPEIQDRVLSVGEKLSAQFLTALLEDKGTPAEYVDLSKIINFDGSAGLTQEFFKNLSLVIGQRIEECGSKVPVRMLGCCL